MIYYEKHGQGKAVILLHSGGMVGAEWQPQIEPLATRFQVFVPDLPAHGKSILPEGENLSIELIGRAVIEMMDYEGITEANICGSSMGGAAALWLAIHHPERVKKLVVYRMTYRTHASLYEQVAAMAEPEYWQKFRLDQWLAKIHAPQGGEEAWRAVIAQVGQAFNPATSTHHHTLQALQNILCPVLLMAGDRDPVAPLPDLLEMLKTIPNAGLLLFPFADHITGSNTWRAGALAEELRRFFG